ncbi:hypothetical protein ONZ45_g11578 [Pleurotus djamor]|nr:hypothetical protein ONZ45_g11578 [Pleurotus djamor]
MAVASFFQRTWEHLLSSYSHIQLEFLGTLLVQIASFYIPCAIYLSLDAFFPRFSEAHKIQPAPKQPTRSEIFECLSVVLKNQVLSTTLHAGMLYLTYRGFHPQSFRFDSELPGVGEVAWQLVTCIILREILFYYSHRLLHIPSLYPKIHKLHHRFTAPVALAAQYAHPIEHIVANILPVTLPPQLLHAHAATFWLFMAFVLLETSTVHSGYDFFGGAAKKHDLHHEKFMIFFGTVGLLDWWHGTDGFKRRSD